MSNKPKRKKRKQPPQKANQSPTRDVSASDASDSNKQSPMFSQWAIPLTGIVVAGILALVWFMPLSDAQLIEQVKSDYNLHQFDLAIDGVQQLQQRNAADSEILMIGASAAMRLRDYQQALAFTDSIDDLQGEASLDARVTSGEMLFDIGKLKESESNFRRALAIDPDNTRANQRLAYLLNILGRRWESSPYAFKALKADKLDLEQLVLFANRNPSSDVGEALEMFVIQGGDDPSPRLTKAREFVNSEKPKEAIPILQDIVKFDPTNSEASVFLGRAFWATSDGQSFAKWMEFAPPSDKRHPDFWTVVGDWADVHNQPSAAIRAYWEALKRDPDIYRANYRLSKLLKSGDHSVPDTMINKLAERAEAIRKLNKATSDIMDARVQLTIEEHGDQFKEIVDLLLELDRKWEAFAWTAQALTLDKKVQWAVTRRAELKSQLNDAVPRFASRSKLVDEIDLSHLPILKIESDEALAQQVTTSSGKISFSNASIEAGIDFTYFNATTDKNRALYMYQLMGASAAIIDFNLDSFPDIYFPQGCDWPIDPKQTKFLDNLFVNRGDGTFFEASKKAKVIQNGFGQSVTVGDFDADGFPDLYVANIGQNRLLRNNGDGSFSDITTESKISGDEWSAGAVVVDLDGDSLPDIYDVNYVGGENVFTKICKVQGIEISCPPRDFDQTRDHIHINQGDGTFSNVTDELDLPPGKGLGVVAGDINNDDKIDLFIGNDGEANFMLVNESSDDGPAFSEMAAALGVDLDKSGQTQACMGIAVLDLNNDHRIDFFVTNFSKEYNTLYQSEEFGFAEATRKANLSSPGYGFVGFGTQALDAELDGDDDILITNGNVQDYFDPDRPFEMPSMFLENVGGGLFKERGAEAVGRYFGLPQVGRGMARLDYNRDGLEEVVIGNLDRPSVLLKNKSKPGGNFISLRLIGIESSRDAIGASVFVSQNGSTKYRQLTAGDGFAASNEKLLTFAADGNEIDSIKIHWPSGEEQTFESVATNQHYIALEGKAELFPAN